MWIFWVWLLADVVLMGVVIWFLAEIADIDDDDIEEWFDRFNWFGYVLWTIFFCVVAWPIALIALGLAVIYFGFMIPTYPLHRLSVKKEHRKTFVEYLFHQ